MHQTWEILFPAIANTNELQICAPLIKWLLVASMASTAGDIPANVIQLSVSLADQSLISHRMTLLHHVLPGLLQPAESLELALTQMALH